MGEVRYMISEASKRVNVETHVLRHWEDELGLEIGRTEMGHRYYTEEDVRLFTCIKELKEQGMLLKELKELIPDMLKAKARLNERKRNKAKEEGCADPQALFMRMWIFIHGIACMTIKGDYDLGITDTIQMLKDAYKAFK